MLFVFSEEKKERKNKPIRQTLDSDKRKVGIRKEGQVVSFVCLFIDKWRQVSTHPVCIFLACYQVDDGSQESTLLISRSSACTQLHLRLSYLLSQKFIEFNAQLLERKKN